MLPDFASSQERDTWIAQHATMFTAVRFLGRGKYERHEFTTAAEATNTARLLARSSGSQFMIYAVYESHDALLGTVGPKPEESKGMDTVKLETRLMVIHELTSLVAGPDGFIRIEKASLRSLLADYTQLIKAAKQAGLRVSTAAPKRRREALKE